MRIISPALNLVAHQRRDGCRSRLVAASDNVAKPLASEMSVKGPFEFLATKPQTISELSRNAMTSFDLFIAPDADGRMDGGRARARGDTEVCPSASARPSVCLTAVARR